MVKITTDNKTFVLSRFPDAKVHELSTRGHTWYAIMLDGSDISLFDNPIVGGRYENEVWGRMAKIICEMETVNETLQMRKVK